MNDKHLAHLVVVLILGFYWTPGAVCAAPPKGEVESLLHVPSEYGPIYRVDSTGAIEPLNLNMHPNRDAGYHYPGASLISPDQNWIAYTRDHDLWLYDVRMESEMPVTTVGEPTTDAFKSIHVKAKKWSPGSRYLIYEVAYPSDIGACGCGGGPTPVKREADYGFYRYDIRKGNTLRLDESKVLSHFLMVSHVAWLDEKWFLVKSDKPPDTKEIPVEPRKVGFLFHHSPRPANYFRVSSDGKRFKYVGGFEGSAFQEAISPDRKRLVADVEKPRVGRSRATYRLWELDLSSGEVSPITDEGDRHHDHAFPRVAPDGESIAYTCNRTVCANEDCSETEKRNNLKVEGKVVAHCTLAGFRYEWIDSRTIVADCEAILGVVDVGSATVLNKVDVPQPED